MSAIIKNLADLPQGSHVFVEANIFDLYYKRKSNSCQKLMENLEASKVFAYVNAQVVTDLIHQLMLAEAYQKGYIKRVNATHLKDWLSNHRSQVATLTNYQRPVEDLFKFARLKLLPMTRELLIGTKRERANYGLLINESLHLGSMNRHHPALTDIVSYQGHFEHVPGITVWKPMDIVLNRRLSIPTLSPSP